ncbi:flagellin lysine-N-methylase [Ruminiclostridium cellulolyticum]|uniref:FliB family protein n=1 Tax=Ruminiclostridium cellulolyticum (strain ATCC 35319 / DSM 5812 / JCM 6584 / H10) TaxID=394503 RepID=B8I4D7_RUMCH|nr:flagellin lysine-N-methylase [Ruminiclostridium cellulolyticum]ACL74491.1 conserved hypothetical protein [Ruminiclostridium cellulolyticum H10]
MTEKKKVFLAPQYFRKFKCIGSECEDSCCKGWKVSIDKETYKKYRCVQNVELRPLLDKYVTRERKNGGDLVNYAKIKMLDEEGICPFLSDKKLCRIQLEYGEGYLSKVCTTYPRNAIRVDNTIEMVTSLSCPEAAKLALLDPEIMEFDEYEDIPNPSLMGSCAFNTQDKQFVNRPQRYFWDLRIFTIDILQNRNYFMWERLIILGLFIEKLNKSVDENKINDIPDIIQSYNKMIEEGTFKGALDSIPAECKVQLQLIKDIIDIRVNSGVLNKIYMECYEHFLKGINYTEEATKEEIINNYQKAFEEYYKPYMDSHEYILENYLVNYVFSRLFPFSSESIFDAYMLLVLHYAIIKVHLIGMAGYNKGLEDDMVIKLISTFTKIVDHNTVFLSTITKQLKEKRFNTLAYMTIMIKN